MSDTQQAARALLDKLHASYSDPEEAMRNYSDDLALIILVIAQAEQRGEQRGLERAAVMVEQDCYGDIASLLGLTAEQAAHNVNQQALAQAIRAAKENMGSACLHCGGSSAACQDWRSRGKLGCCPDCRHSIIRAAKETR